MKNKIINIFLVLILLCGIGVLSYPFISNILQDRKQDQILTEYNEEMEYKLVGSTEANSLKGKISNESPVGKALIGAKKGHTVMVETPAGLLKYKILEITKN